MGNSCIDETLVQKNVHMETHRAGRIEPVIKLDAVGGREDISNLV